MPMVDVSLARGLSSEVNSSVSLGSRSFRRKSSSVTRKGLANLRAVLIRVFISLLFTRSPSLFISDPYPSDRKFGGLDIIGNEGRKGFGIGLWSNTVPATMNKQRLRPKICELNPRVVRWHIYTVLS